MEKRTQGYDNIELFQTLMKQGDSYIAVLSDNSVDRDGEIVGVEALKTLSKDDGRVSILVNHENKVENMVGEWTNRRVKKIGEHYAYIAEPKWFLSNPLARMIKGMLDEGAIIGISIGAIVKDFVEKEVDGVKRTVYTVLELLEASFVAIPSNRHGQAMAVAKMFINNKKSKEVNMASKEYEKLNVVINGLKKDLEDLKEVVNPDKKEEVVVEPEKVEPVEPVVEEPVVVEEPEKVEPVEPVVEEPVVVEEPEKVVEPIVETEPVVEAEKGKKPKEKPKDDEDEDDKKKLLSEIDSLRKEVDNLKKSPVFKARFESSDDLNKDIKTNDNTGELPIIQTN